ncbi:MAG: S8 family serine peptidase [Deltaproteobacteria bacterium]|nr:S8 family serine peptidase [Deltaproteobacteria bacterium]
MSRTRRGVAVAALAAQAMLVGGVVVRDAESRAAPEPDWSPFLSRKDVGADGWTRQDPTRDGRGVVVAILDTGVDPSVAGLTSLPPGAGASGAVKVIETRDFSGEGHVAVSRATVEGDVVRAGAIVARGVAALSEKPLRAGDYWLGAFSEASLRNGEVEDVDRDGRTDGRFAVLAFRRAPDGAEVAIVDTDGDGDLADEKVRRAYADEPTWFAFGNVDPKKDKSPVAFTVTPALDDKRVELHFDDGGHGTHCAGISAGYRIEGRDGFDGLAPGARVMSLKIGHNALSGGATTSGSMLEAIRYASRWARDHATPVVINLSYGVGNEVEGASEIEAAVDEELRQNRWLAMASSAGNEGPGISSVGTPGSALLVWTAGALLPEAAADALYGARVKGRKIFAFSSRGGELDKPDGLSPGVAWSTVPPFLGRSIMNGTSMASPQAAGVLALLIGRAHSEKRAWTPGLVKRALRATARPLPGYSSLEQGAGVIDVGAAWEVLAKLAPVGQAGTGGQASSGQAGAGSDARREVAAWRVSTPVPGRPGATAPVSYWRVGRYLPDGDGPRERVTFKVKPVFYGEVGEAARGAHMDRFTLESDSGWLTVDRREVALRGEGTAEIAVGIDPRAFDKSGHFVGRVKARLDGVTAFELPVAVVVPETFREAWAKSFEGKLDAGDVTRVFVEVPPGATAMRVRLDAGRGGYGAAWLGVFTPEGHELEGVGGRATGPDGDTVDGFIGRDLLYAESGGTWELTVSAPLGNKGPTRFELAVEFEAVDAPREIAVSTSADGVTSGSIAVRNRSERPFRGTVSAVVDAIEREKVVEVKGPRTRVPIEIGADSAGCDLELELESEIWDRFTDVAVNVLDGTRAVAQSAFGRRKTSVSVEGSGSYTLEIVGGHAREDDDRRWSVKVVERHRRKNPISMNVESSTLYPNVEASIDLSASGLGGLPDGFHHRAVVTMTERGGRVWSRWALPLTSE